MKFIPEETNEASEPIIFFEDARAEDGWAGQSTDKSYDRLKGEIMNEINRLKGTVTRWMRGMYEIHGHERPGIQIHYEVAGPNGIFQGRFDVAPLPRHPPFGGKKNHRSYESTMTNRQEESLRMALFNVSLALRSMRILQELSPGFAALMPWLLADGDQTISEIWSGGLGAKALPSPEDGEVIDVPFREVKDD